MNLWQQTIFFLTWKVWAAPVKIMNAAARSVCWEDGDSHPECIRERASLGQGCNPPPSSLVSHRYITLSHDNMPTYCKLLLSGTS